MHEDVRIRKSSKAIKMKSELKNFTKKRMMKYKDLKQINKVRSMPVESDSLLKKSPVSNENYIITLSKKSNGLSLKPPTQLKPSQFLRSQKVRGTHISNRDQASYLEFTKS